MKANKDGYDKVLEYAQSLKVKAQTDYIMMAQSDLNTENLANRLSLEETEKVIRTIIETDINYKEKTLRQISVSENMAFDLERYKHQPVCGVGYDNCCIAANGDVYPCDHFVYPRSLAGNINENKLREIFTSGNQQKFGLEKRNSLPAKCISCRFGEICHGECPKHRFDRTDDGDAGLSALCEGYYRFYEHTYPEMIKMRDKILASPYPGQSSFLHFLRRCRGTPP